VNTLAVRNYPRGDKTFAEFLMEVKENAMDAYKNQDYPFEDLVNKLNITMDFSRNPLLDVLFVSENVGIPWLNVKGLKFSPIKFTNTTSHMGLALFREAGDTIEMMLTYSTTLFEKSTAETMVKHYLEILRQVTENNKLKLKEIKISREYKAAQSKIRQQGLVDFGF
jgi:non-ribosomal peptide synthetase component F